jgi:hypothetical protein
MTRLLGPLAHRMFYRAAGPQTAGAIIGWWECRRLFYAIMAQPGMVQPGEDAVEPFGWIVELSLGGRQRRMWGSGERTRVLRVSSACLGE